MLCYYVPWQDVEDRVVTCVIPNNPIHKNLIHKHCHVSQISVILLAKSTPMYETSSDTDTTTGRLKVAPRNINGTEHKLCLHQDQNCCWSEYIALLCLICAAAAAAEAEAEAAVC